MKYLPISLSLGLFFIFSFLSGCQRASTTIEPHVVGPVHPKEIQRERRKGLALPKSFSQSPFSVLSAEEAQEDWGKELRIALCFAEDFDLYRAITGFKRALFLLPADKVARRLEIEYDIALAYYLGKKYIETTYIFESGGLVCVDTTFPAYEDLLLILYDSYKQLGQAERAEKIFAHIKKESTPAAERLSLLVAVEKADFSVLYFEGKKSPSKSYLEGICTNYQKQAKSVRRAETLNAVFPGAGYWYVGQKGTAVTAFLVNSLFIGTAAYFFDSGNLAAGLITLSLESGWYFGGIYGGGLAAKSYNERLYEGFAGKIAQKEKLYPLMMLKYTF